MVNLSARTLFLADEQTASNFRTMARSNVLHAAITHSMFEFASRSPTKEELFGVNAFLAIFLNLGEPDEAPPQFPDKTRLLNHNVLQPVQPPQPVKEKQKEKKEKK